MISFVFRFCMKHLLQMIKWRFQRVSFWLQLSLVLFFVIPLASTDFNVNCSNVQMGQYLCDKPTIDFNTQQPLNCQPNNTAQVKCSLIPGLQCEDTKMTSFNRSIPCYFTNGYNFETALLLSIFLGMFGADRFYLGYPAIGLLKFSTLGGCFLFQLVDILLIAMQLLQPADGSHYVMKYFGPRLTIINTVEDFALIHEDLIEYMPIKTL